MKGFTYSKRRKSISVISRGNRSIGLNERVASEIIHVVAAYAACADSKKIKEGGKLDNKLKKPYSKAYLRISELCRGEWIKF